ncbi:hypothetical protein QR680_001892 [Steinernema hermaphroditum]|uniref:WD repeat protein mio zinc-ribbon like domain-containing protein n=1 Tax=Steinernema hermaphroditum TaxID=289476 RepID=A0AA39LGI7_9BILA|nr:hypothetical protein QR680_001892 [Steinernema hermaphroditum]
MFHDVRWLPDAHDSERYFTINQGQIEVGTFDKDLQPSIVKTINYDVAGEKHNDACCFSIERRRGDNLIAIGHSDGRICVVNPLEDDRVSELRNKDMCDQQRPIAKLSWSPTNPAWLSAAQLKYRHNDASVAFYDISRSSRNNRDLSSIFEVSYSDATDATWFPGEPETFAISTKRMVKLFNVRDKQRPFDIHIEGVLAITADPLQPNRFACVCRTGIRLYDLRHIKRPIHVYPFSSPRSVQDKARRFVFHPNRLNNLSLAMKDSRFLTEYIPTPEDYYELDKSSSAQDILNNLNIDKQLSYFTRDVPFERKILSFDWHPQKRDRVLLTFDDKSLTVFDDRQFPNFDFVDDTYSIQTDDKVDVSELDYEITCDHEVDISEIMKQRVENGYGMAEGSMKLTDLITQCATVIAADKTASEELRTCWDWIGRVVHMDFSVDHGVKLTSSFPGALSVIHILDGDEGSISGIIDQDKFVRTLKMRTMKHQCRDILLKLCGWPPIRKMDERESYDKITHELSLEISTATRAIAIAFFTCRSEKAREYFDHWIRHVKAPGLQKDFELVRKYIYIFEDTNSFEFSMDAQSSYHEQIKDPYLSAIVLYIQTRVSYQNNLMEVMKLTKMPIADRIAFAAIFMSDSDLRDAVAQMQEESKNRLDGLLICGLGCHEACHKLLQGYIARTGDIQTMSIILIATDCFFNGKEAVLHGVSSPFQKQLRANDWKHGKNSRWIRESYCCVQDYFQVLNSWRMWIDRAYLASLLQARLKVLPPKDSQAVLACSFCGAQAFVDKADDEDLAKTIMNFQGRMHQIGNPNRVVPRTIYNIGNPLYVEDSQSPISHWFVWCTGCHHGGHLSHVISWFNEIDICVVPGCECRCQKRGYVDAVNCRDFTT